MGKGLTITAYARHRGVSHVAVIKAIKAGRIEKEPDGTIDPELLLSVVRAADTATILETPGDVPEHAAEIAWLREHLDL